MNQTKSDIFVCERCGLVAYHDVKQRKYVCRVCGDKAKVSSVSVAYAFKPPFARNAES